MLINVTDWEQTIFPRTPSLYLMFSHLQFPACFSALKHACGIKRFPSQQMLGKAQGEALVGRILYCICEFKRIFRGWVRGRGGKVGEEKEKSIVEGGDEKKRRLSVKQKTGNERTTGEIADFNFLPFWGEINCDYQISYNHCVINHRIWGEQWHIPHCGPSAFCMPFFSGECSWMI